MELKIRIVLKKIVICFVLFCSISLKANTNNEFVRFKLLFPEQQTVDLMNKVFDWQVHHQVAQNDKDEQWARSVFYSGVMYAYKSTKNQAYLSQTIKWGDDWKWKRGRRFRHADDLACGQAYLDAYQVKKKSYMLQNIKLSIDSLMASPKLGREDWWWCDALFMQPSILVRLGNITKEPKYSTYLNDMYWDATDYLFRPSDSLFFRDKRFFDAKTKNGKKVYWSRGNAWVIGGLTQMLDLMPLNTPMRDRYLNLYKQMIYKIASTQQADGLWRASLLDPLEVPVKETSGSTFFTFAMAWGVNNGVLPAEVFLPKITKAWSAIISCVNSEGMLGFVQPIGAMPESVKELDYQEYGSGSFLMAGAEIIKLSTGKK